MPGKMIRNPKGAARTPDNDDSVGAQFAKIAAKYGAGRDRCVCPVKPAREGPPWHLPGCSWA